MFLHYFSECVNMIDVLCNVVPPQIVPERLRHERLDLAENAGVIAYTFDGSLEDAYIYVGF